MLSHEDISRAAIEAANRFSLKKVSYFGSYAEGRASETSDLDILVEFIQPQASLLTLADLKYSLEDKLKVAVDVIHAPVPANAILKIGRMVPVYG